VFRGTLADSSSAVILTYGTLATRVAGAGVKPAVGVGVPGVTGLALTYCSPARGGTVSISATRTGGAGLKSTLGERIPKVPVSTLAYCTLTSG